MRSSLQRCSNLSKMPWTSNRFAKSGHLFGRNLVRIHLGYQMTRTNGNAKWVLRVAEAALHGDQHKLQTAISTAIRSLKSESPETSRSLAKLLAQHANNPQSLRWAGVGPPPADAEEGLALVRAFGTDDAAAPILPTSATVKVAQFLRERKDSERLFDEGLSPAGTVLLTGAPGTGKTMLARWIAAELQLPFLVQDLATSISSLLGRTGLNLRRVLDYARSRPCVLLLDEFDAIAKKRDDQTELGELKRIVNVLLKELEDWPSHSVLIAATNHPALLDPAISRRFQVEVRLPLPGDQQRAEILGRAAGRFNKDLSPKFLSTCAKALVGKSGSEVEALMLASTRRHIVTGTSLVVCVIEGLAAGVLDGRSAKARTLGTLLKELHGKGRGKKYTIRDLATLFGKSPSTIQYHLNRGPANG